MASKIKSVEIATEWWVNKISNPTLFSNGTSDGIGIAFKLARNASSKLSEQQIVNFKEELSSSIERKLETEGYCCLNTDYSPEGLLADVAKKAHISDSVFPWKTRMEVAKEYVKLKDGYGKKLEMIYIKKR